ncbi:hypothetical protein [Clostridium sp. SM-530-WT-3G]|uniref:hypothetical protein n=1 Tax=Clostridium sp. SM-530-WT-3G TaxID=2725303 RepID=UPI00145F37D8|nr:hypothetical protein [Clostridium sp. SM-530-WT-3G]NME82128.1 hypothetical protein [Clostridium sp. SM-530-WT-3G]
MNIFAKSVMEHTDSQYNEYGNKVKDMQQDINFDLQEYKDVNQKIIRLDSLGKTCDILMGKAKEERENNISSKIVKVIKVLIILFSLYSAFTKISPQVTNGVLSGRAINNIIVDVVVCIVTIIVVSCIAKVVNEIIKKLYDEKIIELSLKKAVIESNYKQLSKDDNILLNNELIEIK